MQHFQELVTGRHLGDYIERLDREHSEIIEAAQILGKDQGWRQSSHETITRHKPNASLEEKRALYKRARDLCHEYRATTGYPGIVKAFARKCTFGSITGATESDVEQIAKSYDGSVDFFIRAFDLAIQDCQLGGYSPSENDFADLLHLLYLEPGDVLVSEERDNSLIIRVARKVGISLERIEQLEKS